MRVRAHVAVCCALALATIGAREQEVRNVDPCQDEHEERNRHVDLHESRIRRTREELAHYLDADSIAAIGLGISKLERLRESGHLGLRLIHANAVAETRDRDKSALAALPAAIAEICRPIEIDVGGKKVEVLRQNTDDRMGSAVELEWTAEHLGIAREAAHPEIVREDDHVAGPADTFSRTESTA